jgi:hypothetical protein
VNYSIAEKSQLNRLSPTCRPSVLVDRENKSFPSDVRMALFALISAASSRFHLFGDFNCDRLIVPIMAASKLSLLIVGGKPKAIS